MVRPDVTKLAPAEQDTEVRDPQDPENNWILGLAGALDKVMVGFDDCATKVYHTSFLEAIPQPIGLIVV